MASGTLTLRPSADISIGHILYPAGSTAAYLLINEETSDNSSTYIRSDKGDSSVATSKFALSISGQLPAKKFTVSNVVLHFDPYSSSSVECTAYNEFNLEINGISSGRQSSDERSKESTLTFTDVIPVINDFLAVNGTLPPITLTVISHGGHQITETKVSDASMGITQAYLTVSYDEITDIGIHHKVNGSWVAATAAYRKVNGAWVEISADECKAILRNSVCVN